LNFKEDDLVYEIGTGKGHLTESLAKRTKKVISIEKDKYLTEKAKKKLKTYANVRVYHVDVLKYSFPNKDIQYRVFGNIPFNISTDIVRKVVFHSRAYQIDLIVEYGFALRLMDTSRLLGALLLPEVEVHILKRFRIIIFILNQMFNVHWFVWYGDQIVSVKKK
jgi:23S rRNA (adenine-N6)-dimethyltransferase